MKFVKPTSFGLLAIVCACCVIGSADAAYSPRSLRTAILRATSTKRSVHYVSVSSGNGAHMRMVSDVAGNRGIQRVTFSKGGRTGHATTLVVKSTGYVRADAFALRTYMGFPATFASRYAGHWFAVPQTSPLYRPVAIDVTFRSFVSHIVPKAPLSLVRSSAGGRKLVGLRGESPEGPASFTIYVPARGKPLPVEGKSVSRGAHPVTTRVSLSHWNEAVRVKAPANALPLPGA